MTSTRTRAVNHHMILRINASGAVKLPRISGYAKHAQLQLDISLPEIGGYTDSEIFVNKKSKKMFSNFCRPQMDLDSIFP